MSHVEIQVEALVKIRYSIVPSRGGYSSLKSERVLKEEAEFLDDGDYLFFRISENDGTETEVRLIETKLVRDD